MAATAAAIHLLKEGGHLIPFAVRGFGSGRVNLSELETRVRERGTAVATSKFGLVLHLIFEFFLAFPNYSSIYVADKKLTAGSSMWSVAFRSL